MTFLVDFPTKTIFHEAFLANRIDEKFEIGEGLGGTGECKKNTGPVDQNSISADPGLTLEVFLRIDSGFR